MSFLNPKLELDFSAYIADRTSDFTGREWVFQAIQQWLHDPQAKRFFLLTGEPGCGKTAIAARLTQFSNGEILLPAEMDCPNLVPGFLQAVHFCSATRSRWIDPRNFCQAIALQLAQIEDYAKALLKIETKQITINSNITAGTAINSSLQGVVIQSLDLSGVLSAQEVFNLVVLNPLQQLYSQAFNQPITILIDSLDEALTHKGQFTIVDLLSRLRDLSPYVRFLLTSRPHSEVLTQFKEASHVCELTAGSGLVWSREDVSQYATSNLEQQPTLVKKLAPELSQESFIQSVRQKSDGNFLYANYLLRWLLEQATVITPATLEALPTGLDGIYREFLGRIIGRDKEAWRRKYAPVLGTLAVAQEALNREQLAALVDLPKSEIVEIVHDLRQLLDVNDALPASQRTYALYHRSLADFLLDEDRAEDYFLPVQEQHQRIVTYYLMHYANQWQNCDYYGLSFIVQHVLAAEFQSTDLDTTLNKIFTSEFMEARLQQFGWHMPLVQDLQRIATVDPALTTRLCLQIIHGERPNSLVLQKVLHLLEQLRNQLGQLGRSDSVAETEMDQIILALGHPPETAVTQLSDLFHATSNPRIQSLIALALGETGSSLAVPFLMTIILDRTMNYPGEVKWAAADGLIALGDRTIASDLIRWFDETDWPSDKERIIYILGRLKAKEAQALIPKGLNSSNTKIVGRSLDLMWLLPCEQEYEPFLLQKLIQIQQPNALNESDPWSNEWVQKRLVAALGRIGSCETQTKLEEFREQVAQRPKPVTDKLKQHQRHQLKKSIEQSIQEMERRCH